MLKFRKKMEQNFVITTPKNLKFLILETLKEHDLQKSRIDSKKVLLHKKEAMKILKIGYEKLMDLINTGIIKVTENGKISEFEIDKYLGTNEK